ncbi:MAG TPA: CBS domain-containing protein [archaeon]|nr:CBS domain-containing protein [archaeon]
MLVKDLMSKNVVSVRPDEHISQAVAKMEKNKIHQLLVMSDSSLYGMLELKKIVSREIDISSAKVENLATNVPNIDANASVESAAQLLLSSAARALPVTEAGSVVGVISESDLMRVAKQFVKGLNSNLQEILTPAIYLGKNDNFGSVKRLLFDKNISRVPVVDSGKVIGVVSTFEMLKVLRAGKTMEAHGGRTQEKGAKERLRLVETPVTAIMRPATALSGSKTISDAIELLKTNEELIVNYDGGFGVVTPKDIVELFAAAPKKEVYVQITGMHNESIEFKARMDIAVTEFVTKIAKIVRNIEYFVVHVDKMQKQGNKSKYSIRVRFKASEGFFVAHAWGWKPLDVIQEVFRNLESEILHKYGKVQAGRKKRRFASKGR